MTWETHWRITTVDGGNGSQCVREVTRPGNGSILRELDSLLTPTMVPNSLQSLMVEHISQRTMPDEEMYELNVPTRILKVGEVFSRHPTAVIGNKFVWWKVIRKSRMEADETTITASDSMGEEDDLHFHKWDDVVIVRRSL